MGKENAGFVKQRLFRGHVSLGIILSLLMYHCLYFGILAIFLPFIQVWEKPSRHFPMVDIAQIDYASMVAAVMERKDFPGNQVIIELPGFMGDPALRVFHPFTGKSFFNPATGQAIRDEGPCSNLAMFLNGMHYGRPLKKVGLVFFGFMAVGMLFLMVGGLWLVNSIRFKNSGKTPRTRYSKWHRKIFTWTFPLFILIVLCGAVMGLSFDGAALLTHIATKGETANIRPVIGPVLFPEDAPLEKANKPAAMRPIGQMLQQARQIQPRVRWQRLTLTHWGDETARIKMEGHNPWMPFLNGVTNKPALVFNGRDGRLVRQAGVLDRPLSVLLTESVYFIHLLFGVGPLTRLLVALAAAAGCLALGCGAMLWLRRKAKPFKGKAPFYHWMAKLSLTVIVGVLPATGALFVLQYLLPFDLEDRLIWQQGAFFNLWLAALFWSFYRIDSYRAARSFLALGGILFFMAPLLHFIKSGFGPLALIQSNLWTILSVDTALGLTGILLLVLACKMPGKDQRSRALNTKRLIHE